MNKICTVDLTKRYGDFIANDKINLCVRENEIKCIVGENGAGKSTLMNMLYGIHKPSSGKIIVDGKEVIFNSPQDAMDCKIGMVHQHFKLVPSLSVYENIFLGTELVKKGSIFIDEATEIKKVEELIKKYHFQLNPRDKVKDISVGLCQQIEILKMLYRNVDTLILDEPTSVLTPQEVDRLIENLKELKENGKTIIVITHKLREVMELSDSITVIKHGKVVGHLDTKSTNEEEIARMMVGRDVVLSVSNKDEKKECGKVLYAANEIATTNKEGNKVLSDISFKVHSGEVLGIAGVEGNGQSELVKLLSGILTATKGEVYIDGQEVTNKRAKDLRRKGLGIIPEDRYAQGLCKDMTIYDNCIAGYHDLKPQCKLGIINKKECLNISEDYIKKYDIRVSDRLGKVSQLSGGNAQKIIIAREFENNPKVIIACQPTRGVDVGSIEFIHKQLIDFRNKGGAVLLISSELSEIMSLSDRVAVMFKGKIIGEVEPKDSDVKEIGLLMTGTKLVEEMNDEK